MSIENIIALLVVLIPVLGSLAVAVYNVIETRRLAGTTSELEQRVHRLSVDLDQSIQRLQRVTELTNHITQLRLQINIQKVRDSEFALDYQPDAVTGAQLDASEAELKGLVLAIGDDDLIKAVTRPEPSATGYVQERTFTMARAQTIHKRTYELLEKSIWDRRMR